MAERWNTPCLFLQKLLWSVRTRSKDCTHCSIKDKKKVNECEIINRLYKCCSTYVCLLSVHVFSAWTFECTMCRVWAGSGGFLISPTPWSCQLVSLGLQTPCGLSHAPLLLLSPYLCPPPIVWRLRKDTGQVTVAPHWGIGFCLSCKHALSLSNTMNTQITSTNAESWIVLEMCMYNICVMYSVYKSTTPKSFHI